MKRTLTISLDVDWLWRVLAFRIGSAVFNRLSAAGTMLEETMQQKVASLTTFTRRHLGVGKDEASRGLFARTWPIGITTLWIAVLFTIYILVYFL